MMETLWEWPAGPGGPAAILLLAILFALGLVFLAVWIALPFVVLGARSLLRDLVATQKKTNEKLEAIEKALKQRSAKNPLEWDTEKWG